MSSSITTAETINQERKHKTIVITSQQGNSHHNSNHGVRTLITKSQIITQVTEIRKSKSPSLKLHINIDHQTRNPTQSSIPHHNQAKRKSDKQKTWSKVHNSTTSPSVKVNNHLIKARTKMATKPYQPNQKITQVQKDQSTTITMSQVLTSHPKIN
ncbi:hypothetical protein Dimus_039727 [Dionaea muscipula]